MKLTILQLNRLAILLDEAASDFVRVDPTDTHRMDGTVVAQVDGRVLHIIDRDGKATTSAPRTDWQRYERHRR